MDTIESILKTALNTAVNWQVEKDFCPTCEEFAGIEAITYDGLDNTATFAYLGIPKDVTEPVPALVLVHGGGGQAFLPWVKLWNDRGYAAIAMSTRGMFPQGANAGSRLPDDPGYRHGMHGSFLKEGYIDSPDEDALRNSELPLRERWMTHALVKVIHAHNLLRSLPQVDNHKIGITGISWGGNITSIAITHDPRFAFAVPVYGSGYLKDAISYMGPIFRAPGNAQFRAEDRFQQVKMPVLWVAWNDDNNFSVNSNSLSYLATAPNNPKTSLALIHEMWHDHPHGWAPPVIYAFADWVVKKGQPLITFASQPEGNEASARLSIPAGASDLKAKLYWIDAPMTASVHDKYHYDMLSDAFTYMDQVWQITPATISGDTVWVKLPENAQGYYLEVCYQLNGEEMIATSVYTTL